MAYARHLARANIAYHRDTIAEYREDAQLVLAALAAAEIAAWADRHSLRQAQVITR